MVESVRVCVLAVSPLLACLETFLPYRRSPSRGSCRMERTLDLLCCCCIPFVRIGEEVGGGVADMRMKEELVGCLQC